MNKLTPIGLFTVFLCRFSTLGHPVDEQPTIRIPDLGDLVGIRRLSYFTKRPIDCYLGINYAKSPSGERRFQPPVRSEAWNGVLSATKFRQQCPQLNMSYYPPLDHELVDTKSDLEDCLVVNVFSPQKPKNENSFLPVLVFFHGGTFFAGSAYDFFPDFLLEKDLILVVVQYRLGPLGFSSLDIDELAGNMGLLDMVAALHWVQDNIKWFGGDPQRVTVAGQSAGAAAVSSMLVSPMVTSSVSKLFSQIILQSGSATAAWATDKNPINVTKNFVKLVGCVTDEPAEIVDCLKRTSIENIIAAELATLSAGATLPRMVIQNAGAQKYLTRNPSELFREGKFISTPLLAGFTRDEATFAISDFYLAVMEQSSEYYKRNSTRDLMTSLGFRDLSDPMIDIIQSKYLSKATDFDSSAPAYIDMVGSYLMKGPTMEVARHISATSPTYIYSFNFKGNISKLAASDPDWDSRHPFPVGVAHSDELGYLFPSFRSTYTERELQMVHTMTDLWTSFVINGRPTSKNVDDWSPMIDDYGPYLRINDRSELKDNYLEEFNVNQREGLTHSGAAAAVVEKMAIVLASMTIIRYFCCRFYC